MQQQTRAPLKIDFSPAGALAIASRKWNTTAPKARFMLLAASFGIATIGLLTWKTTSDRSQAIAPPVSQQMLLSTTTPAALAGITATTPPMEQIQRLYDVLPQYEQLMGDVTTEHLDQMLSIEAKRLHSEAMKEVQSGHYVGIDPATDIDLGKCPEVMESWRCVLFRYAGDGLTMIQQGDRTGDIYQVTAGYLRFKAALLALNPPAVETSNAQPALQSLLNYRIGVYDVTRLIPLNRPMTEQFDPVDPSSNAAEAIQQTNPVQ